jgi:hypothetical protein
MPRRRQSTLKGPMRSRFDAARRNGAGDATVDQIKSLLASLQRNVEAHSQRITALQAQIDHLDAKVRGV